MTQVPTWLAYAGPLVALLALCVAAGSFAVAIRTYRRAGPSVKFEHVNANDQYGYAALVNSGLAKVKVDNVLMVMNGRGYYLYESFWLEGGETKRIIVPILPVDSASPYLEGRRAIAILGNGELISAARNDYA